MIEYSQAKIWKMRKIKKLFRELCFKLLGRELPGYEHVSRAKFAKRYPNHSISEDTFGLPTILDWHQGTTLKIGSYCSITKNVEIFLGGTHRMDWVSTYPFPVFFTELKQMEPEFFLTNGNVIIRNDVWLGRNCKIMSGVTIGDSAVVATGALDKKKCSCRRNCYGHTSSSNPLSVC